MFCGLRSVIFGALICGLANPAVRADIWNGPPIAFIKPDNADWSLPENQDRITDNVWITRKNNQGIFNIKTESGYVPGSPADTEWAYGTTDDLPGLTFSTWDVWHGNNPASSIGRDAVLHLISEDIFIDIRFLSWTGGNNGGGFSYMRSTKPIPEPAAGMILIAMIFGLGRLRCSRD